MTLIFRQLFKLVRLLNSETGANSIATGLSCGIFLGFSPILSLQGLLVFLAIFLFRIQLAAALVSMFFFKLISPLLTPLFHWCGDWILGLQALESVYETLYNLPLIAPHDLTATFRGPYSFVQSLEVSIRYRS